MNLSGTESWWIDRNRSAPELLAVATRRARLGRALPSVTISRVQAKPSDFSLSTSRVARFRLNSNSGTLRALIAPSDFLVCPTSTMRWNFAGSHFAARGPVAAFFSATGFSAVRGLAGSSDFTEADVDELDALG